jgi:hypothetical protein
MICYSIKTMKTDQIICCVVALLLGMLLSNMLKNVCGCKVVEGLYRVQGAPRRSTCQRQFGGGGCGGGTVKSELQCSTNALGHPDECNEAYCCLPPPDPGY